MTSIAGFIVNSLQRTTPVWQPPVWQVNPTFTDVTIGHVVGVTAGNYVGVPAPTLSYEISIDGVAKPWPYTLQIADAGKTMRVVGVLTNAAGARARSAVLIAVPTTDITPGVVSNLVTSDVQSDRFTVSWGAPLDGGTPATYTVGYRVSGTTPWTTQTTSAMSLVLSGLAEQTSYDVEVFGTNQAGSGAAATQQRTTSVAGQGYWPTMEFGMNVPGNSSYAPLDVFTNRALCEGGAWVAGSYTSLDANGMPTDITQKTLSQSAVGHVNIEAGDWGIIYHADAQRTASTPNTSSAGTAKTSTYDSTSRRGVIVWTYPANSTVAFTIRLDGPVDPDLLILKPADYATYLANGNSIPFFNAQFLRTCYPYDYLRFMDVAGVNGDFTTGGGTSSATFNTNIAFGDLNTPTNYHRNSLDNSQHGWPLAWLVDMCNQTSKGGWFNITMNMSDAGVTAYGTYIASNLNTGLKAKFELGNEAWNYGAGFKNYYKNGVAGFTEVRALVSVNVFQSYMKYDQRLMGITLDGTKAVVRCKYAHGATTGDLLQIKGLATGYSGYNTGNVTGGTVGAAVALTVIDDLNVSFPCTTAAAAEVAGTTLLAYGGFIALNAGSELMKAATSQNELGYFWFHRRQYDVAKLLKAAFTAAGRAADCQTMLAQQAGATYYYQMRRIENFFIATGRTDAIKDVFTATTVGGYLNLDGSAIKGGYTNAWDFLTPSGADTAAMSTSVLDLLQTQSNLTYALYGYSNMKAWADSVGIQTWIYEVGLDTYGSGGDSQLQKDGKVLAQSDARIATIIRDFMWGLADLGMTAMGWYKCSAGTYVDTGCFNLGNTADEIDYTTTSGSQSKKFQALLAARQAPATVSARPTSVQRKTNHSFPCRLSGYDFLGNESATAYNASDYPYLGGANTQSNNGNPAAATMVVWSYSGASKNGLTYEVRSEITRTATITLRGHVTGSTAKTISLTVLGSGSTQSIVAAGNSGSASNGVTLGSCQVTLRPGFNKVFVSSAAAATNISIHEFEAS